MGINEIVLFTLGQQVAQALAKYAKCAAAASAAGPMKCVYEALAPLADNAGVAFGYGLTAARAEFAATQNAESQAAQDLGTLPPIS